MDGLQLIIDTFELDAKEWNLSESQVAIIKNHITQAYRYGGLVELEKHYKNRLDKLTPERVTP